MDLTAFYATVSATGFTLLGLWWVVVDKHPEWFRDPITARMAYIVSLHFMIPSATSLLSLVAPDNPAVWRVVFVVLGLTGLLGAVLVARQTGLRRTVTRAALLLAVPVYVLVVLVALVPSYVVPSGMKALQVEAFLVAAILVLGLHAVWFFSHQTESEQGRVAG